MILDVTDAFSLSKIFDVFKDLLVNVALIPYYLHQFIAFLITCIAIFPSYFSTPLLFIFSIMCVIFLYRFVVGG